MPPLIKVQDQPILVPTASFPCAKWPFEYFNPVQSRTFDFYDKEINSLVSAPTSCGKTIVAEQFLAHEVRKRGGKGLFLAPLRALSQEKADDWRSIEHNFGDLKTSIITGDFRLSKQRYQELQEADVIVATSETLSSLCRNYESEKSDFLKQVGTLVVDESHLLTTPNRGAHLEVALMKFTEMNNQARLVLLSATMPNVDEVAEWISYVLTKRETVVVKSNFRPVKLNVHYEKYYDGGSYDENENEKVNLALDIIDTYPNDKFLVFAHSKRIGETMIKRLKEAGIQAEFHNAALEGKARIALEKKFRNDPNFKIVVATPTLSWGCNLPARRVILLGVHRGLEEVENYNIIQEIGRSGRLGLDPCGDAYVLLPESEFDRHKARIKKPSRIESQLLNKFGDKYKDLAFHLVSEIHYQHVQTKEDIEGWYKRSLAYYQNKELDDHVIEKTLDSLKKCGAIWEEDEKWTSTGVGAVASLFYFSPYDVADLKKNFSDIFSENNQDNDYWLSMALGNIDSLRSNIVSKAEKKEFSLYEEKINILQGSRFRTEAAVKAGFCYFNLLNGNNCASNISFQRTLQMDFPRVCQILIALDGMSAKWGRFNWLRSLEDRIRHGVKAELLSLCRLPNIGKARAKKLYEYGIKTSEDFAKADPATLRSLLNLKSEIIGEILEEAKQINSVG